MSAEAQNQQPSATQSAAEITSHDDVVKAVSGSGTVKPLHRATSDAYPAGAGPRTRDDRRSPTAGGRRGRGLSKPVEVTHSAPEAAAAATAAPPRSVADPPHGDHHQHRSDSDDHDTNRQERKKKKQSTTSSWERQQLAGDTTTSNTVLVTEPRIISPPPLPPAGVLAPSSYGEPPADNTASASDSSQGTESQKEPPRGYQVTVTHSRQRCTHNVEDPARPKVKSEGKQRYAKRFLIYLKLKVYSKSKLIYEFNSQNGRRCLKRIKIC